MRLLLLQLGVLLALWLPAQNLTVTGDFAEKASVAPDEPIELRLNRPLRESEGKLAVIVGTADLTGLFAAADGGLRYGPGALPLPAGETQVVVYLVGPDDEWREVARLPLRVAAAAAAPPEARRRFGFDKVNFAPALNLGVKSQFAETHSPASNRPERPRFADLTVQGGLKGEVARGGFSLQGESEIVGSSFRREALRFAELGDRAPLLDLSSYLMQFRHGQQALLAGHTTVGAHRHLLNNLTSRGLTLSFPLSSRADLAVAAMSGTSIVGWDNFFGVGDRSHQVLSGTLGLEFFPERRGGLRAEAGVLDGRLRPRPGFNQGNVNDAEQSRGLTLRLVASDPAGRLRLDAGWTRSKFTNPDDPLLDRGESVVPVAPVTRGARYLDVGYDLLKDFALTPAARASLTLNFRHERVDPLFRSVGAVAQADRQQDQAELLGALGEASFSFAYTRFGDNLADIPSVLKTLTRRHAFAVSAPLATLLSRNPAQPSPLWPRVGYTLDRVRQAATSVPVNGGFIDPSTIPDQMNLVNTFVSEWQAGRWRLAYRLNHSSQDNRQPGRERADLRNAVHEVILGWNPLTTLELNAELGAESALNRETERLDRTLRFGFGAAWRMSRGALLSANLATTGVGDAAQTSRRRNTELDLQWTWRFGGESADRFKKVQTTFFLRYANRLARARDDLFGVNTLTRLQTFNTGLNFIFF